MNRLSTALGSGRRHGFTLIELLIVIIILGILGTVVIIAVNGIRDRGTRLSVGAESEAPAEIRVLNDDLIRAADSLVDPDDKTSTQSLVMALVVNTVNSSDPNAAHLDPAALKALRLNVVDREQAIVDLIGRIDALLAASHRPKDRLFLALSRNDLVQILDGLRKIKATIPSPAGG